MCHEQVMTAATAEPQQTPEAFLAMVLATKVNHSVVYGLQQYPADESVHQIPSCNIQGLKGETFLHTLTSYEQTLGTLAAPFSRVYCTLNDCGMRFPNVFIVAFC